MDLTVSDEIVAMTDILRERVEAWEADRTSPEGRWAEVVELGFDRAFAPEDEDGLGLGMAELIPALEALGPVAADWPWAATLVCGPAILRGVGGFDPAEGPVNVAIGGRARFADRVSRIAVLSDAGTAITSSDQWVRCSSRGLLDEPVWWQSAVELPMMASGSASTALAAGRIAEAAVLMGAGKRALELAIEYAKIRQQFGTPIGALQAVKHLAAEAKTELAFAGPVVLGSAISLDTGALTVSRDAALALLAAGAAAQRAIRTAIQLHGAIGYTNEVPLGRLLSAAIDGVTAWGGAAALDDDVERSLLKTTDPLGVTTP